MKKILGILVIITMFFCHGCAPKEEIELPSFDDTPIYYTVSFVQEGQETKTITVEKGKKIDESQIPQIITKRVGYTSAWEESVFSFIKSDLTVNVVYTPNEYKIFYYLEKGGEVYYTQIVTFDEEFTLLNGASESDKKFVRWTCVNAEENIPQETWTKDGNLELYAIWEMWSPFY